MTFRFKNKVYMNKFSIILIALLLLVSGCRSGKEIRSTELPPEIHEYVVENFSNYEVVKVIQYQLDTTVFYDVDLNYGVRLGFNGASNEIISIKGNSALPDAVIGKKIRDYVDANYPSMVITGWKLDRPNQLVEIENKYILEFNNQDDFIRIGD